MNKTVRMIVFLMGFSTVCVLVLAGAQLAYDRAAAVFNVRLYQAILELYGIEDHEGETERIFAENFTEERVGGRSYWTSTVAEPGTVVFTAEGSGLWSRIELLLAVEADGESLYGLRVLSQAETPGLGGRIAERGFQERFRGVAVRPAVRVVKFATAPTDVDAIAGASRTSAAVGVIINQAIRDLDWAQGRELGDGGR